MEKNAGFDAYYVPIPETEAPVFENPEKALARVADCKNNKDGFP